MIMNASPGRAANVRQMRSRRKWSIFVAMAVAAVMGVGAALTTSDKFPTRGSLAKARPFSVAHDDKRRKTQQQLDYDDASEPDSDGDAWTVADGDEDYYGSDEEEEDTAMGIERPSRKQAAGTAVGSAAAADLYLPLSAEAPTDLPIGDLDYHYHGVCKRLPMPTVPDLETQHVWRSAKPRSNSEVTLVTQLSVDRLPALQLQCAQWSSVIAAAVYIPVLHGAVVSADPLLNGTGVDGPQAVVKAFFQEAEASGSCKLDMAYVTEPVASLAHVGLYPVNALRNRALQLARTDVLLLLDADFIPNSDLAADVTEPHMYDLLHRATSGRQAIVLPAFETVESARDDGRQNALRAASDKSTVRRMMKNGRAIAFHSDHFENGHRATDFERWVNERIAYKVAYEEGYEPYVLVQRKYVPWYDERFKGYRKNKVVHLMHMEQAGMTFVTTPRGWVVHVAHPPADTWAVTQETGYWNKLKRLYALVRDEMLADTFVPAAAFRCDSKTPQRWSWYRRRMLGAENPDRRR